MRTLVYVVRRVMELGAFALLCGGAAAQVVLPERTPLEIRLTERVGTHTSKEGSPVRAILAAPVLQGDKVVLPLGSKVEGRVVHLNSVGLGLRHETSSIGLEMDRITLPDGTVVPITAKVAQIENSREVVQKDGRIAGVRSTSTLSHRASGAVGTLAFSNPVALVFTTASSASLLRFSDPEISLPANAELILLTTAPLQVGIGEEPGIAAVADDEATTTKLQAMIRKQPFRTMTTPKPVPSDITNLMLIGNGDAIMRAFQAAGWMQVDNLTATSTYQTIRSISEQEAYHTAPMSLLLLDERKPTYALAKTLDTFSKRHHLRVYPTNDQWGGERVWLSSSTQDIGIGFSKDQKTFIHQIDHNIDHERTKVVNDLMLTGCVSGLNLAARPWLPEHPKNGTGEDIVTDGRIAVIRLNDCATPLHVPSKEQTAQVPVHPNVATKATRQTTLTLRNMVLRDNLVVTAYGGVKQGLGLKHPKPPEQPIPTESVIDMNRYAIGHSESAVHEASTETPISPDFSADPVTKTKSGLPRYSVELGIHSGYAGYAGGNGGAVGYVFLPDDLINDPAYILALGNEHSAGWNLGGSVTLNTHEHLSHEFTFDYNRTGFQLQFADLNPAVSGDETDPTTAAQFAFDEATLSTTEFGYNLQYHLKRRDSRWRPYVFAGPSLRLMHMTDAPITKASPWFKLGLSTVGILTAAWKYGTTPPLEGGGVFQVGLQYGGGVKYRMSRRLLMRADYKETLTGQPDFWSKSKNDIFDTSDLPGYSLTVLGPIQDGPMRQQRVTMGVSFVF
ncbi:LssY C-terminal domain-containing protein [Terriglobus sp. RCC_193]|uniref:LssY C-terminal domain-containing protein n=1 Tax=Terriglobus sp. RCC_193 TaxID=3239218 RepID=UPI0035253E89